ncbi:MAG: ABC transporter permease [Defluviitaleaceae bacterium]|nr:ABC transporter permease [Defluviitaleaceae bacterium]MCL2273317.1 ABC transporter permease [Defluviitaleaceae bacterium]
MTIAVFNSIMHWTIFIMIPLIVVSLGGLFSEKSGVVNIALEGKMILGAFFGTIFMHYVQNIWVITMPGWLLLLCTLLIATIVGIIISLVHAYASINLRANQVISGIAINMFAAAFAIYGARSTLGTQHIRFTNVMRIDHVPGLGSIPFIGPIMFQNTYFTSLLGIIILLIVSFVLFKTKFGLRLRACGEHPQAADSVGISVSKMRYAGVILSGALAGMGGVIYIIPIAAEFSGTVAGYGFLALAVLIFGAWNPKRIFFAALFFGLTLSVASQFTAIPFLRDLGIHANFFRMTPYVATLVVLALTSKNTLAPKAVGQPYDKGGR